MQKQEWPLGSPKLNISISEAVVKNYHGRSNKLNLNLCQKKHSHKKPMEDLQIIPIIGKEFADKIIPLIEHSKKSIDIIVYDWKWYPDQIGSTIQKFNNAIVVAKRKGIRVRVITTSSNIDRILSRLDIETKKWMSRKTLHTKLTIIDNKIAILGSHNYTMNAFTINYEVSVIIQDEAVVKRLNQYFNNLWW